VPFQSQVLKEDLTSRVERVTSAQGTLIRKSYAPRAFFLWRTFLAPSKARREHDNLLALAAAGIPVTLPVAWEESRVLGCVPQCRLWLVDAGEVRNLKEVLARDRSVGRRRGLLAAFGALLAQVHRAGFVSLTAYPRNVVVVDAEPPSLLLCDQPYLVRKAAAAAGRGVRVDLFDALFTPGRASTLSRADKLRALRAYSADRAAVAAHWRALVPRSVWRQRLVKGCIKVACRFGIWSKKA
jgi:hypothetical protein